MVLQTQAHLVCRTDKISRQHTFSNNYMHSYTVSIGLPPLLSVERYTLTVLLKNIALMLQVDFMFLAL